MSKSIAFFILKENIKLDKKKINVYFYKYFFLV